MTKVGMPVAGFDWDSGNWPKCGKHDVKQKEIEEIFSSEHVVIDDPYPFEERFRAIGKTLSGRYIFLVFMFREKAGQIYIRPISARYMHKKEIAHYENQIS